VKLLDLGLAYLPGIDVRDAVKPGGTLRYMAPELLKGTQANARSEVFALGVTIYRMFSAGPFPFGQGERLPLSHMRPDLPSWLGHILAVALSADPALRYPDAAALSAALHNGLVTGTGDPPKPPPRFTPLLFWQLATFVFAAACAFLLLRK
jgi:serine/threonine protein kinase